MIADRHFGSISPDQIDLGGAPPLSRSVRQGGAFDAEFESQHDSQILPLPGSPVRLNLDCALDPRGIVAGAAGLVSKWGWELEVKVPALSHRTRQGRGTPLESMIGKRGPASPERQSGRTRCR